MSSLMKAAEDIKNLCNRLKGFMEVGEVLEKIGSFEQAERDAITRSRKACEEEKKAQDVLYLRKEEMEQVEAWLVEKTNEGNAFVDRAIEKGEEIARLAEGRGREILKEAGLKRDEIKREMAGHQNALIQLQQQITEKNQELSEVIKKIEQTKAAIASIG